MTLVDLPLFQEAKIERLSGDPELVLRLSELGFTVGEIVRVTGNSLFRSPIYVEIRGAIIALRSSEALCIQIQN